MISHLGSKPALASSRSKMPLDPCHAPAHTVQALGKLTGLTDLNLHELHLVTDEGVEALANLTALRCLDLGHVDVSDRGLAHLATLQHLECLSLCNRCG